MSSNNRLLKISKMKKNIVATLISFFLVSCSFNSTYQNREEDKNDAKKVTEEFFNFIKQGNNDDAFKLFSNKFFQTTSKDRLLQVIDKTTNEYGKIQNDSLFSWRTFVTEGANPTSKYELTYQIKRDSGNTREVINLEKEKDSIKIMGYRIDFDIVPKK